LKRKLFATAAFSVLLAVGPVTVASAHSHASKAEQAQEAQVQKIVQTCVSKGNFLTKHGRQGIVNCIAPKGHSAALETCVEKNLIGVHSKATLESKVAQCAEKNR